ncbi:MAG: DUF1559 domain-containing protein, partial [Planctomycetaceae bacterium]|nr:DUF1559 domain-containing protein [Planctomycetaceae bacterium]
MKYRNAFTLIELIVVVIILLLIITIIVPWIESMHNISPKILCSNNLKQIALACQTYKDTYGSYPPAFVVDAEGQPLYSWRVLILPFLEYRTLYDQFHLDEPWDSEHNKKLISKKPPIFQCHYERRKDKNRDYLYSYYAMVVGANTISSGFNCVKPEEITDGMDQTLLIVETRHKIQWSSPQDVSFDALDKGVTLFYKPPLADDGIGAYHNRGANVVMIDGTVKYLSPKTKPETLKAL